MGQKLWMDGPVMHDILERSEPCSTHSRMWPLILVECLFCSLSNFISLSTSNPVARINSKSVVKDQLTTPWPKPQYYGPLPSLRSIAKEEE